MGQHGLTLRVSGDDLGSFAADHEVEVCGLIAEMSCCAHASRKLTEHADGVHGLPCLT
jgi:hypothetical protein